MLKKYLSKFTVDILPSVFATVVGAYIVNYYIIPKAREDRPPAPAAAQSAPAQDRAAAKPAEAVAADAAEPAPPSAKKADKPVEKAVAEKSDKPDTAKTDTNKAAESRRHPPTREKAVAKAEPSKAEPVAAAPAPAPVLATVGTAPSGDANDLARAAIERLSRGEKAEAPRAPDVPRVPERTAAVQPASQQTQSMQQLPPPIVVSNPSIEQLAPAAQSRGPRPPGDVPVPMRELQASADERGGRTNVVEDVLSGAKSMFDKVIPRSFER